MQDFGESSGHLFILVGVILMIVGSIGVLMVGPAWSKWAVPIFWGYAIARLGIATVLDAYRIQNSR